MKAYVIPFSTYDVIKKHLNESVQLSHEFKIVCDEILYRLFEKILSPFKDVATVTEVIAIITEMGYYDVEVFKYLMNEQTVHNDVNVKTLNANIKRAFNVNLSTAAQKMLARFAHLLLKYLIEETWKLTNKAGKVRLNTKFVEKLRDNNAFDEFIQTIGATLNVRWSP
jgi:hypothetical protein